MFHLSCSGTEMSRGGGVHVANRPIFIDDTGRVQRYSQDAIAEFQYVSNRFNATLGRSSGVQVRAVTRSGTNVLSGSVRGNFRSSRFNAKNPVLDRVVPIDNQQIAFTLGGPVLRDRLHFFGHFEYERKPRISIWNTPLERFNVELEGNDSVKLGGGAARLSALAGDPPDGKSLERAQMAALRRRGHEPPGRNGLAGGRQRGVPRAAHARGEQPGRERSKAASRSTTSTRST
jgi:hypothetical protein